MTIQRYSVGRLGEFEAESGMWVIYSDHEARVRVLEDALRELLRVDDDWHGSVNSEMANARAQARAALREDR